jgi:two-component system sensor histidine kinase RpfC
MERMHETRIPIVGVTADATMEARAKAVEAGMDACLAKPVEIARLVQTIESLVPEDGRETGQRPTGLAKLTAANVVTHPRFQGDDHRTLLDRQVLENLRKIGAGSSFVESLIGDFLTDAEGIVAELERAALNQDHREFADLVHGLKGSAANVGAISLYETLATLRGLTATQLKREGSDHAARIREEFEALRQALAHYIKEQREAQLPH